MHNSAEELGGHPFGKRVRYHVRSTYPTDLAASGLKVAFQDGQVNGRPLVVDVRRRVPAFRDRVVERPGICHSNEWQLTKLLLPVLQ